jgi:hypothetical protein
MHSIIGTLCQMLGAAMHSSSTALLALAFTGVNEQVASLVVNKTGRGQGMFTCVLCISAGFDGNSTASLTRLD